MDKELVACYCRVSTKKDEQLASLEHQKAFFHQFMENNPRYALYHMYVDKGITGTSLKRRNEFNQMVSDAKKGCFKTILVKDISRFARNTLDTLDIIRELKRYGVTVEFVTYAMDTLGNSEFVLTVLAAIAQEESQNLSNRVKFGKKQGAKNGRVPSLVYGYDKVQNDQYSLTVNQVEAEVVKRVFDLYVNRQMSSLAIARLLNSEGIRGKRGRDWSQTTICTMLKNRLYIGQVCNGKSEVSDFITGNRIEFNESEWIVTEKPEFRIIGDGLFQSAQEIMQSRRNTFSMFEDDGITKRKRPSIKYPLSNMLVCANDNYSFRRRERYYDSSKRTYTYWTCSKRDAGASRCNNKVKIEETQMHKAVHQFLMQLFDRREIDTLFRSALGKKLKTRYGDNRDTEQLLSDRMRLEHKREKLLDLYLDGTVDKSYIAAKMRPIDAKLAEIQLSLEIKRSQEKVAADLEPCLAGIIAKASKAEGSFDNPLLKQIFRKFIVYPDGRITAVLSVNGDTMDIPFAEVVDDGARTKRSKIH